MILIDDIDDDIDIDDIDIDIDESIYHDILKFSKVESISAPAEILHLHPRNCHLQLQLFEGSGLINTS